MKAKYALYTIMIVGLLAGLWAMPVGAQQGASTNTAEGAGIASLSGSMATFDPGAGGDVCWATGSSQTFCFLSESYTSDWEYAYDMWLKFPSDWTVTNVTDIGPNVCDYGGSWGSFSWSTWDGPWEVDVTTTRYQANPTDHCYTYICVDVVTGSGGDVSWYWDGDGYGSGPHWPCSDDGYTPSGTNACDEAINPVASIPPCAAGIYLNPGDQEGGVEPGGSADFDLTVVNLSGMEETVDFTYSATGPGTCYGPAASDPIADGDSWPFLVTVDMDPGAGQGDVVDCEIYAVGQNSGFDDTAYIHAEAMFPGPEAFALDVYPGYNLVYWPDLEIPNVWTPIGSVPQFHPAGDFLGDDYSQLYALDYDTNQFVSIDTATGARTVIGTATPTGSWTGMTGTADGSTLYASSSVCGTESYLYTVDPASGALSLIGSMRPGSCMIDIAVNAAGDTIYGVDIVDDSLYSIDPATGAATYIGTTGAAANYAQGMDMDFATGTLYWAAYTSSGELRTLDTGSGMSTLIGGFPGGNEVDCLAIVSGAGPDMTVHVGGIKAHFEGTIIKANVLVEDQDGTPMPGADVQASVWAPNWGPRQMWRMTNPNGKARFMWGSYAAGNWEICVDDIVVAGYSYAPGDNVITCKSWMYR